MDLAKVLWCILALVIVLLLAEVYRLATGLATADQVLPIWEYIAELPFFGSFVGRIFTMILQIMNPYSRSIDFRITSFEVGRCSGNLRRRRISDGPFHCTHGAALTLFAETLAGLAVFSRLLKDGKGILLKTETEYVKKAKGTVTGFAAFDPNEKELVDKVVKCDVVMKDEAGEVVAKSVTTFKVEGMEFYNMRA